MARKTTLVTRDSVVSASATTVQSFEKENIMNSNNQPETVEIFEKVVFNTNPKTIELKPALNMVSMWKTSEEGYWWVGINCDISEGNLPDDRMYTHKGSSQYSIESMLKAMVKLAVSPMWGAFGVMTYYPEQLVGKPSVSSHARGYILGKILPEMGGIEYQGKKIELANTWCPAPKNPGLIYKIVDASFGSVKPAIKRQQIGKDKKPMFVNNKPVFEDAGMEYGDKDQAVGLMQLMRFVSYATTAPFAMQLMGNDKGLALMAYEAWLGMAKLNIGAADETDVANIEKAKAWLGAKDDKKAEDNLVGRLTRSENVGKAAEAASPQKAGDTATPVMLKDNSPAVINTTEGTLEIYGAMRECKLNGVPLGDKKLKGVRMAAYTRIETLGAIEALTAIAITQKKAGKNARVAELFFRN